jgi:hypothetical protein
MSRPAWQAEALTEGVEMNASIQVFLYGSLLQEARQAGRDLPIQINLGTPLPLPTVLSQIAIPVNCVQLVMVNHRAVSKDVLIRPSDRVSLFPKEYPIFADWSGLRLPP